MFFMDWSEPELLTGPGAILKLPEVIKQRGISKVMIVTDKGLMSLNLLDGLFGKLEEEGISYVVYDGVQPNPSIENIEEAREMFVSNGCEAMIAFGGGSPMDCAKAACARVVRPNKTIRSSDYCGYGLGNHACGCCFKYPDSRKVRYKRSRASSEVRSARPRAYNRSSQEDYLDYGYGCAHSRG